MGKTDLAVKRLEEKLNVSFSGRPIAVMQSELRRKIGEALKNNRLHEILFSDASQATAKVLDTVWEAAKPRLIGRELAVVIAQDAPLIKVPRAKISQAFEVAEGAEIPVGTEDYDSVTLTPKKYGVRPLISREMVEDSEWDVIEYQLAEAGRAMADLETEKIVSQMISDAGNSVAAGTGGTLSYGDVVNIVKECLIDGYTPDALAIHPSELADLLKDTAIQKAMEWGGEAVAPSGQIARLLGMQVLVSTKVPSGTALVVDSKHAGVLFIRRDITAEDYEDPVKDLAGVAVTARWAYTTLRADAIGKVTGC
ncbi:MAG: phage major capsid protein [Candidatus Bathyarchaeia archaeon]|nr:phage major capsid protein [Candidatus Bathyarchaeota archaeon A05DMB-4]MDH7595996.1 phage major capsid protein [Candidatus Bathyarchaeota archaeon]